MKKGIKKRPIVEGGNGKGPGRGKGDKGQGDSDEAKMRKGLENAIV